MHLRRVFIDGYRNLSEAEARFERGCLTTVIIGENGSGKSNLIEAIVEIFRAYDFDYRKIRNFSFDLEYEIRGKAIKLTNRDQADGQLMCSIVENGSASYGIGSIAKEHLPDLVFGYYSGTGRRLEKLFDAHQLRYYSVINRERADSDYEAARIDRRLFYCRPIHGVLALFSHFAMPRADHRVDELLTRKLGITGFHSALAHLKEPSWFNEATWRRGGSSKQSSRRRGRRTHDDLSEQALDVWGSRGPAGKCARNLLHAAFHPLTLAGKVVDDYRHKPRTEAQLACFLKNEEALNEFAASYKNDRDLFAALEAADISDLFREIIVWVTRTNDDSGDISFSDLSDGERQLLMVLGLIRVSRGQEALFLLDEPDTHLNPAWQLTYLDLIREWTEVTADEDKCQILLTSHNPLTIAALTKEQVRVMRATEGGKIAIEEPFVDPRGMGFTSTLTEVFGLPTTLDPETQQQIDERNELARLEQRSEEQERLLIAMNDKLSRLGFAYESRDPLYDDFLKAVHDFRYADKPTMTPDQIEARRKAMHVLIKSLSEARERAH